MNEAKKSWLAGLRKACKLNESESNAYMGWSFQDFIGNGCLDQTKISDELEAEPRTNGRSKIVKCLSLTQFMGLESELLKQMTSTFFFVDRRFWETIIMLS